MIEYAQNAKLLLIQFLDAIDQHLYENNATPLKEASESVLKACVVLNNQITENILPEKPRPEYSTS